MSKLAKLQGSEIDGAGLAAVSGGWTIFGSDKDYGYVNNQQDYNFQEYNQDYSTHDHSSVNVGQQGIYSFGGGQISNAVGNESHGNWTFY